MYVSFFQVSSDIPATTVTDGAMVPSGVTQPIAFVFDQSSGRKISVGEAERRGLVDLERGVVIDHKNEREIPIRVAAETGLLQMDETTLTSSNVTSLSGAEEGEELLHRDSEHKHLSLDNDIFDGSQPAVDGAHSSKPGNTTNRAATLPAGHSSGFAGQGGIEETDVFDHSRTMPARRPPGNSSMMDEGVTSQRNCVVYSFYSSPVGTGVGGPRKEIPITEQMVREGRLDTRRGVVVDPETSQRLRLSEAIERGIVFSTIVSVTPQMEVYLELFTRRHETFRIDSVYDSYVNRLVPVKEALYRGIIDPIRATYTHTRTGSVSSLREAMNQGLIKAIPHSRPWQTLDRPFDNVHARTVEEEAGLESISPPPEESLERNISSPVESTARPSQVSGRHLREIDFGAEEGKGVPVAYSVKPGYEITPSGEVMNTETGQVIPLNKAINLGVVSEEQITGDGLDKVDGRQQVSNCFTATFSFSCVSRLR